MKNNIENEAKQAYEVAYSNYKNEKLQIYKTNTKENWLSFLIQEAKTNKQALKMLQSNLRNTHYKQIQEQKNIQPIEFLRNDNEYIGYGKIAKNGEIHYKTIDDGYFKIDDKGITIIKDTQLANKQALDIAIKMYGNNLKINGNKEFIQQIQNNSKDKNIKIHRNKDINYDR